MSRRTFAIAVALSVLAIGSPMITGCTNILATQYFNQGVEKNKAGDYQGAVDDLSKAIEIDPEFATAFINRGINKGKLKDCQGSIVDFSKALENHPEFGIAYLDRGITRELANDLQGACDDWRKAADLDDERSAEWVKKQC